jgi:hypothetical protein
VAHNFGQNQVLPEMLEMEMTSVTGDPTEPWVSEFIVVRDFLRKDKAEHQTRPSHYPYMGAQVLKYRKFDKHHTLITKNARCWVSNT